MVKRRILASLPCDSEEANVPLVFSDAGDRALAEVPLISSPTIAIAMAPTTAPVNTSIMAASAAVGSFMPPPPLTTVSTIACRK
jgi:hypothetical protein